jgi:hypothetical protein
MKFGHSFINRTLSFCVPKKTEPSSRSSHQPNPKKVRTQDSYTRSSSNQESNCANTVNQASLNVHQNSLKDVINCFGEPNAKNHSYGSIPAVQQSRDETVGEVLTLAQAVVKRQFPVQQALIRLDEALENFPETKELLLARALLNFDAQNVKECIADCRAVLKLDPINITARSYEIAALHISKTVIGESLMQDVDDTLESHRYVRAGRPMRLAVIISHSVYAGAKVSDDHNKIEEVKSLYHLDPTDRCVCALMGVMHFERWYRKAELNHAVEARTVAQTMLKIWPHDRIATSIIHHLDGHDERKCAHKVDFESRNPFYGTTIYPRPFLRVETVLDYPLSVLDPSTGVNFWKYVTQCA